MLLLSGALKSTHDTHWHLTAGFISGL